MMRIHLIEFEDQSWCPRVIRDGGTDYLRYLLKYTQYYEPVIPLIAAAMEKTGDTLLVDLCSGGGGNIEEIYTGVAALLPHPIAAVLTDRFPSLESYAYLQQKTDSRITYAAAPVDAAQVPSELKGFRTLFSAIHHFRPAEVSGVLRDAVRNGAGIAVFDGGNKNLWTILAILLIHPLAFLLLTPLFRPFRLSRLLYTYLVPLIPIMTVWDGCVSVLRLYSPAELQQIAEELGADRYRWNSGKVRNKVGMQVTYLIGYPVRT